MPRCGKKRRWDGVRFAFCITLLLAIMSAMAGGKPAKAAELHDVAEIVRKVESASQFPAQVRMHQSVVARLLLITWRFTSVLEYVEGQLKATTTGAPAFVPEDFPVDLVSLSRALPLFDLKLISEADDNGFVVIGGPRPDYDGRGAEEATFRIDPSDWLVKRASAKYDWGTLTLEQEFDSFNGYMLLRRQKATVLPYGLVVDVEYSDYSLVSATADRSLANP